MYGIEAARNKIQKKKEDKIIFFIILLNWPWRLLDDFLAMFSFRLDMKINQFLRHFSIISIKQIMKS